MFKSIRRTLWAAALCLWLASLIASTSPAIAQTQSLLAEADIAYELQPILERGELKSLRITLRFNGQRNGETTVYLPNEYAGQTQLWRQIGLPSVQGGTLVTPQPDRWTIKHKPRARVIVAYDLITAFDTEPALESMMAKPFRPIIRPNWFSLVGSTSFVRLNVDDQTPIRFRWRNIPRGWQVASDLEHTGLVAGGLMASSILGGKDVRILRVGTGGTRIAMRGNFGGLTQDQLQTDFAKINAAQRTLWRDSDRAFFISLAPIASDDASVMLLGTGLGQDAFAVWAVEATSREEIIWLFAHEHLHAWLPRQVGGLDGSTSEISSYWFSEGFTNFYTARTLVRSALWTPEDWIKHWNEVMGAYQTSRARLMPAAQTIPMFWTDRIVGELPYQRGALIALTIDQRIKQATNHTKSLDDVMVLMRTKARTEGRFAPELLIESVREVGGFDITSLVNDVAINGQAITFSKEAWGQCIVVKEEVLPVFDVGFEREQTAIASNIVRGVRQNGPAYFGGLRDGMKILRRTTGKLGDASVLVTYDVEVSPGKNETLSWFPIGPAMNVQRLTLGADLAPSAPRADRAKCLTLLGGG
jgi:predicted metalloprotease with PDZ domain